jgi:hypothetical protein
MCNESESPCEGGTKREFGLAPPPLTPTPENNDVLKSHMHTEFPLVEIRIGTVGPFHARLVTIPDLMELLTGRLMPVVLPVTTEAAAEL